MHLGKTVTAANDLSDSKMMELILSWSQMAVIRPPSEVFEEKTSPCLVLVGGDKPHTIMNRVEFDPVFLPDHLFPLLLSFSSFIPSDFPTSSSQTGVSWMKCASIINLNA